MLRVRLAVGALMLAAYADSADAHDFYSNQCCHGTDRGGDCEPLPFDAVTERSDGWRVDFISPKQGEVHEFVGRDDERVLDSQDGRYHVCLRHVGVPERIRCFYKAVNS